MAGSLVLVGLEHRASETFSKRVRTIKTTQRRWRETFEAMAALSRDSREKGEPVNVIFMRSYFNQHTLKPLAVDRLIEYHRQRRTYTVVEGLNRGEAYTPQPGDFLLTIDKRERKDLGQDGKAFGRSAASTAKRAGRIFRHRWLHVTAEDDPALSALDAEQRHGDPLPRRDWLLALAAAGDALAPDPRSEAGKLLFTPTTAPLTTSLWHCWRSPCCRCFGSACDQRRRLKMQTNLPSNGGTGPNNC